MTRKTIELNTEEDTRFSQNYRNEEDKFKKELSNLSIVITDMESYLGEHKSKHDKKIELEDEIGALQKQYKDDKKEGMIRINEAEFEKIKDVKKLTEEMDFKVKETQANLMALNDE